MDIGGMESEVRSIKVSESTNQLNRVVIRRLKVHKNFIEQEFQFQWFKGHPQSLTYSSGNVGFGSY
nr:hypothetical protein Iba_chr03aCG13290 [Ipomoea batatas]